MSSLYRAAKGGTIIGIIVENKLFNRLEMNLERVITINHGFSVLRLSVDINGLRFASSINIDLGPQQT